MNTPKLGALVIAFAAVTLSACGNQSPTSFTPAASMSTPIKRGPAPIPDSTPIKVGPAPIPAGVLGGHLYVTGGPAPGMKEPRAGKVIVTGSGFTRKIAVGEDGRYSISLPPGTYSVAGSNPRIAPAPCIGTDNLEIVRGATVTVDVICPVP